MKDTIENLLKTYELPIQVECPVNGVLTITEITEDIDTSQVVTLLDWIKKDDNVVSLFSPKKVKRATKTEGYDFSEVERKNKAKKAREAADRKYRNKKTKREYGL